MPGVQAGGEGAWCGACLTCGLAGGRLGWTQLFGWQLWPWLSSALPGVTGPDIKAGSLINCAILPPAALNMLWPRRAVAHISSSPSLFCLFLSLYPLFQSPRVSAFGP